MQIKTLTLKNFRGFKDTEITFSEGLTVLVGVNGAGKSSVLDALAMLMSHLGSQLIDESGRINIKESDIHTGTDFGALGILVEYAHTAYSWEQTTRLGGRIERKTDHAGDLNVLALAIRKNLTQTDSHPSIPVMIYYPANRAVTTVPIPPPEDARILQRQQTYAYNLPIESENFHSLFKWFRAREDYENEKIRDEGGARVRDEQLDAVRLALAEFLPQFTNFVVRRFQDALTADKNDVTIRVDRLSDGEKLLIGIVGDIARRLVLAAPDLDNPLQGEGVVLIDEIEQHLHPAWQRTIIGKLRQTFPNVQFIVSTHSPQVLGEVKHDCIRRIAIGEDGSPVISTPSQSLGLDANLILEELFGAPSRNKEVATELTNIFREIDKEDAKSLAKARREIKKLKKKLNGEIPDLVEAEAMLFMLENN